VLDEIQSANGKEKAEQRKANADARAADATKTGVPLEVLLQDPELRENYPGIDAYYEAKATREQVAKKKAVEAGLDNPEDEDMISAAQAARPFNISPGTLIKMARAGKVPGRQIVGRWKFYLSQVQKALMGKTTAQLEAAADERLDDIGLSESTTFGESWGESDAMREIFAVLERVRDSRLSVLLLGETGTGKEAIARGLHVGDGPFIAINAAELDEEPGDAAKQLRKAMVAAAGGTLFLDEVGDTPRASQSALLRILAGEHNARIVSATSRPADWLRPDLYYRLAEVEVEIPPLRDRESDVAEIAKRIYAKYTSERGYEAADPAFTDAAIATMLIYPWPGNIRELKSAVSRGVELAPRATPIGVEHMQLNIRGER
jgi:transcriptional regulator with PAS, ATPase and Fis domain